MAVSVKIAPTFSIEMPRILFRGAYVRNAFRWGSPDFATGDISPDGKRFLMMKEAGATAGGGGDPQRINSVLNWAEEPKQRVPIK
jgi:hypothetical protein